MILEELATTGHTPESITLAVRENAADPDPAALLVNCAGGYRSSTAASLLRASGFADVSDLLGGWNAWRAENPAHPSAPTG